MSYLTINLEVGNWYKVIYDNGDTIAFKFLGEDPKGTFQIELPSGQHSTLDLGRPFRAIV